MAKKPVGAGIRFYTDGSAARQIEVPQPKKKRSARLPRPKRQPRLRIYVDPLALCSIAVTGVLLVLMAVDVFQLTAAKSEEARLEQEVLRLHQENLRLEEEYRSGYDLAEIEKAALDMGMIPVEEAEQIPITVTVPVIQREPTRWERICDFFESLFA